jgi:hypothetical protein
MQEVKNEMLKETPKAGMDNKAERFVEKGVFQPSKEKRKGVYFPEYWRKKKLNRSFVDELEKSANSEPFMKDRFGEYRLGTFLHGCAVVKVEITDDLLNIAIHSEHPVGFPMVKEIRYKFAPDSYLMTMLMPSREQKISDNTVVLYQIPGSFDDNIEPTLKEHE